MTSVYQECSGFSSLLDLSGLAVALEMMGKFTFAAGVCMMYVYGAEIYPTVLRTTATGTCSLLSRAGSSLAPFFFNLGERIKQNSFYKQNYLNVKDALNVFTCISLSTGDSFEYLPYIILGSLTLVTGIASFLLPETFGRHLPQSIDEMPKARG